ncbi:hypothetical protein B0A55_04214 [Friedmanniomyces simplex]|uniref:Uncharacterized protein n=1 Tax=Friedmanniomyces simplex TaxID=329884 RepID=A0A4U0XVB1_9PEZI|nr:hypothetical protein B0A55_04214 [Friedmanniomyces simplex]
MTTSSLPTSPDPLTLPSSPLAARSTRSTQRDCTSSKPRVQRGDSSPSKSFVLDTGAGIAGEASPWRFKVTVEAEPRSGSGSPVAKPRPGRRVPVKGMERRGTSITMGDESDNVEAPKSRQPQRKRKATPTRGGRRTATKAQNQAREDPTTDDVALMPPPPLPSTSSAVKARRRSSLRELEISRPTQRSKRLSRAREELGVALREAVGGEGDYSGGEEDAEIGARGEEEESKEDEAPEEEGMHGVMAGDMTVAGDEDFTMVSVETLQSMRQFPDTSLLGHRGEWDRSAVSVSYLPSSPPKRDIDAVDMEAGVRYPDLSHEARQTREGTGYDAMSWKPTTLLSKQPAEDEGLDSESSEWRRAREVVSRRIQEAGTSQVIVIEDDTVADAAATTDGEARDGSEADEDDIWQEEASRSVEEESEVLVEEDVTRRLPRRTGRRAATPTAQITQTTAHTMNTIATVPTVDDDFLADQPVRPRRSKIPRTWRRTSGVDFTYSDSPAHIEPLEVRKRDLSTDGGGSRASSGVLTPPSSGDEQRQHYNDGDEGEEDGDEGEGEVDFTRPDDEATLLQQDGRNRRESAKDKDVVGSLSDDSASSVTSPDGDDTGMFWQDNLPAVYRRERERERPRLQRPGQQKRAMDLSELLNLEKSSSPVKQAPTKLPKVHQEARHSPLHMRPVIGRMHHSDPSTSGGGKVVSSPLRRSLLRSSKVAGGSPVSKGPGHVACMREDRHEVHRETVVEESTMVEGSALGGEDVGESFASKASHQRQLLTEMAGATRASRPQAQVEVEVEAEDETALSDPYREGVTESTAGEEYVSEEDGVAEEPSHSYEEHLNIESPQKIRVKFGDSLDSSLLAPKRAYAPLFASTHAGQHRRLASQAPPTLAPVSKKPTTTTTNAPSHQHEAPGLLSLLTTTFWSAVIRPTGPTSIPPSPPSAPPPYPPTLRAHLRSRYGVLSTQHPWTMAHMRTLHRMLNSCSSGKSDSIIPRPGIASPEIPAYLLALVGKQQSSTSESHDWYFSTQHAQIVLAFSQVLVSASTISAMERGEVEMLGDAIALEHRSCLVGRRAGDMVWGDTIGVRGAREVIEWRFVVRALGDCLKANLRTAAREIEERGAMQG